MLGGKSGVQGPRYLLFLIGGVPPRGPHRDKQAGIGHEHIGIEYYYIVAIFYPFSQFC